VANPAVVLDIDETSLSNWEQIYRNDLASIPGGSCDKISAASNSRHKSREVPKSASAGKTLTSPL